MSGSVNKVILIGNLGKDPEIRRLENGTSITNFSLATSETHIDKKTGARHEITDWHNVVCWRDLAEIAEKYLRKGHKVYIEGKLKHRSWTDQNGVKKYITEIIADELTLLTPRDQHSGTSPLQQSPPYPSQQQTPPLTNMDIGDAPEDDLPF